MALPSFGPYRIQLNSLGVETNTGRGFWGGVGKNGKPVVTSWIDTHNSKGQFYVWRPRTNHGGLKDEWDAGNIRVGTEVRLILLKNRAPGADRRVVGGAAAMPGKWRVIQIFNRPQKHLNNPNALIEQV
jgi:hypothetical protein